MNNEQKKPQLKVWQIIMLSMATSLMTMVLSAWLIDHLGYFEYKPSITVERLPPVEQIHMGDVDADHLLAK